MFIIIYLCVCYNYYIVYGNLNIIYCIRVGLTHHVMCVFFLRLRCYYYHYHILCHNYNPRIRGGGLLFHEHQIISFSCARGWEYALIFCSATKCWLTYIYIKLLAVYVMELWRGGLPLSMFRISMFYEVILKLKLGSLWL